MTGTSQWFFAFERFICFGYFSWKIQWISIEFLTLSVNFWVSQCSLLLICFASVKQCITNLSFWSQQGSCFTCQCRSGVKYFPKDKRFWIGIFYFALRVWHFREQWFSFPPYRDEKCFWLLKFFSLECCSWYSYRGWILKSKRCQNLQERNECWVFSLKFRLRIWRRGRDELLIIIRCWYGLVNCLILGFCGH